MYEPYLVTVVNHCSGKTYQRIVFTCEGQITPDWENTTEYFEANSLSIVENEREESIADAVLITREDFCIRVDDKQDFYDIQNFLRNVK